MKKIILVLLCVVLAGCNLKKDVSEVAAPEIAASIWAESVSAEENPYKFAEFPFAVIAPHDLSKASEIKKFYESLTGVVEPSVILVVAPWVESAEASDARTCSRCVISTSFGEMASGGEFFEKFLDEVEDKGDFTGEEALLTQMPFIKKYFPEVGVVPLLLNPEASDASLGNLSAWLDDNLPQGALVILSEDFSSYELPLVSDFHNLSAMTTLKNFDYANVYDLEVDSQAGLNLIMQLAEKRGYMKVVPSWDFVTFFEGEAADLVIEEGASILSFGNFPADSTLFLQDFWHFDPNYNERDDRTVSKLLRDIRGQEDRFLRGVDFLAFDFDEAQPCTTEEQNNFKIAFCTFLEGESDFDETVAMFADLRANQEVDLIYLLVKFNESGQLTAARKEMVEFLADGGADVIVGRGLKRVEPLTYYEGSLIFYSLGDFVTESKLANELLSTSSGLVFGLYATPTEFTIYPYPIDIINGYPKVKEFEARKTFFNFYVMESEFPRQVQIDSQNEIIKIAR